MFIGVENMQNTYFYLPQKPQTMLTASKFFLKSSRSSSYNPQFLSKREGKDKITSDFFPYPQTLPVWKESKKTCLTLPFPLYSRYKSGYSLFFFPKWLPLLFSLSFLFVPYFPFCPSPLPLDLQGK